MAFANLFHRMAVHFERKQSKAGALIALTSAGRATWSPRDYATLAQQGFARNTVVYRCVRMIAEAAASVPLQVLHQDRLAPDHPLARLLRHPNPSEAGPDLLERFFGFLQTAGNAYLEAGVGPQGEPVGALYALRPDRVSLVPGPQGWPQAYDYSVSGRTVRIGEDADGWMPVLHLKLFHPTDDHYGFSPLEAAAFAIDVHNASSAWNKALLDNAARPSGALIYKGADRGDRLTPQQFDRLKTEISQAHTGPGNAGRPLVLDGGLDWLPMSMSPADMDFIAGKHAAAREIALAFGVPPQLLGIPGDSTYANYREANVALWRQTVIPLVQRAARALSGWLAPRFPGTRLQPELEAVPALTVERDALWTRLDAASFLTPSERRQMAGVGA